MNRRRDPVSPSDVEDGAEGRDGNEFSPQGAGPQGLEEELAVQRVELEAQMQELEGAQIDLVRSREAFRELFHAAPVGYVGIDARGMIRKVNETFAAFLGAEAESLVATPLGRWVAPEDERSFFGRIRSYLRHPEDKTWELRFVRKDGCRVWLRSEWSRIDPERWRMLGSEVTFLLAFMDVTALREASEREAALEAKVRQVQKLESLGVLAGGIAHDFNNLLATIMGNTDLARAELEARHPASELLEAVLQAADTAAGLCRQMLAYAGQRSLSSAPLDFEALVRGMARILAASLPKGIRLDQVLDPVPEVLGDGSQLQQVVMNLVTNAAEAMEGNQGTIDLRLAHRELVEGERESLVLDALPGDGAFVVLTVRDRGCGMAEETRRAMFDPFFTTKFTGRGLGLAAVVGILRAHQGGIRVESAPDRGATISVYLPVARPVFSPQAVRREEPSSETGTRRRAGGLVYLVDDEASVRAAVRRMLLAEGFDVEEASDGVEAIEGISRLVATGKAPDCIILDMTMPRKGGREVFDELEGVASAIPVIVVSGYSREAIEEGFGERKPAAFLQKPYRRRELIGLLDSLLVGMDSPSP